MTGEPGPGSALQRTLHRDYYRTEALFQRERERIFWREWFCLAREEELPLPGAWLAREVAGESVLLVRTREGALAGHYNVCRHRGARLVPE
ncbi:MAG TPA: Rieske 2Fe-2S domain-containing protein, partial [Gemmatimonadales bacterium]|nr:Rieske 2Fe-2S domain-containing protein [Gemmatimonadales bacterium]